MASTGRWRNVERCLDLHFNRSSVNAEWIPFEAQFLVNHANVRFLRGVHCGMCVQVAGHVYNIPSTGNASNQAGPALGLMVH